MYPIATDAPEENSASARFFSIVFLLAALPAYPFIRFPIWRRRRQLKRQGRW
jgi:hypothetical protein